jgi:4-hydroxy-tetrahydrodipicolinate synthase
MFAAFHAGDVGKAAAVNRALIPSYQFETGDAAPNPGPSKCVMRILGLPAGPCRLPMGPEPDGLEDEARALLVGLGKL